LKGKGRVPGKKVVSKFQIYHAAGVTVSSNTRVTWSSVPLNINLAASVKSCHSSIVVLGVLAS
jgi:hypothetical protein